MKASPISAPSILELAELYQKATKAADSHLASMAKQAAEKVAAAEAMGAEATNLAEFVQTAGLK